VVVMQGAIFVLCVLFLRKGVVGTLQEFLANREARKRVATEAPAKAETKVAQ